MIQVRLRVTVPALFGVAALASSLALNHMDEPLALLLIVPGYLVQAWLFEAHRALGGVGYALTIVTVSAVAWTLLLLGPLVAVASWVRRLRRKRGEP